MTNAIHTIVVKGEGARTLRFTGGNTITAVINSVGRSMEFTGANAITATITSVGRSMRIISPSAPLLFLLQETGDAILQETGEFIALEQVA